MEFAWEPRKAEQNRALHGVAFAEAATIFGDPMAVTYPDPDHPASAGCFLTFGLSTHGQLLVVAHTEQNHQCQLRAARRLTTNERKLDEAGESFTRG